MALITKIKTIYSEVVAALGFTPENAAHKGVANGYAGLDAGGRVPSAQLPSYVDDVLEFASLSSFPATGAAGIIYLALDTNIIYRWSGSTYVEIAGWPTDIISLQSPTDANRQTHLYPGALELSGGAEVAFIDFKNTASEDFDIRIHTKASPNGLVMVAQGAAAALLDIDATNLHINGTLLPVTALANIALEFAYVPSGVIAGLPQTIIVYGAAGSEGVVVKAYTTFTSGAYFSGLVEAITVNDSLGNLRSLPSNNQGAAYVPVAADNGKVINITTGGVTVNSGVFSVGNNFIIFNNSAVSQTITQGAGVTMYAAGSSATGNRTLSQRGLATVLCVAANTFVISGAGLS